MKRRLPLVFAAALAACSFAPVTVPVADFFIRAGSSGDTICYREVSEAVSVSFRSVVYQGDALYTPGVGVGDNDRMSLAVYGRASDPDPGSSGEVECILASEEDVLLAEGIVLEAGVTQRLSAGGAELADLVTRERYWLGGSLNDDSIFSFPGEISFTNGVVRAHF